MRSAAEEANLFVISAFAGVECRRKAVEEAAIVAPKVRREIALGADPGLEEMTIAVADNTARAEMMAARLSRLIMILEVEIRFLSALKLRLIICQPTAPILHCR